MVPYCDCDPAVSSDIFIKVMTVRTTSQSANVTILMIILLKLALIERKACIQFFPLHFEGEVENLKWFTPQS